MKKILIISGGSGSEFLHRGLIKEKDVKINFLINLYDDGKSTGELRNYFDNNILGPSDLRKIQGLSYSLMKKTNKRENFFNYRFSSQDLKKNLRINKKNDLEFFKKLYLKNYPKKIQNYVEEAINLFFLSKKILKSKDLSLANLVYSFIANKYSSYNLVEKNIREIFKLKTKVYFNDCTNLFIFAINRRGQIIKDESTIVNYKKKLKLEDIYFTKSKLNNEQLKKINSKKKIENKIKYLDKKYPIKPKLDLRTKKELKQSDILIFAPGTQFSSLFPTYLTENFVKNIKKNSKKILILNLRNDLDTIGYTLTDYFNKINYFLFNKNKIQNQIYEFFDYILINKCVKKNRIFFDINIPNRYRNKIIFKNFENNKYKKIHDYNKIKKIIYKIISNEK